MGRMELTRRGLLKAGAFGILSRRGIAAAKRPNVLFLMADQHRGDCLGADGNRAVRTPNLDRIAAEGVRFRCAYSSTPTCTPARAGLLTGMSPWNHGMLGYGRVAEKYPVEMPRAMREAGYYTTGIGKMHWHPQRNSHGFHQVLLDESGRAESPDFRSDYRAWFWSEAPGLDPDATGIGWNDYPAKAYVLPERLHPTQWTGDCAVRFLEGYRRPEPFFLKVSFARPHSPYDPPQRFMDLYADVDLPEAHVAPWAGRYRERNSDRYDIWRGSLGPAQVRSSRQGYYGSVSFIDEQIGRILDALEKRGMLEETLILYTSDHGDMTGDHNLWRKSYAYEPSARVPMLMRWPAGMLSAKRGQVMANPVELRDLLPTFLDAAGSSPARQLDGASLLSLVKNVGKEWRSEIDLEHDVCYSPENHWSALTDGRMKYIFHARDGEEQLFNLESDRHEMTNLAGDVGSSRELKKWRDRMINHLAVRGDPWVVNGKLGLRPERQTYSPNYPEAFHR
ncbi:MAG: arylsulfatase [Bryobacteraceae bacterium]|nr:arylsulfatase [Bryobacteraceae bacterium]